MAKSPTEKLNPVPALGFVALILLAMQFLLGLYATLFVELPETGRWAAASAGVLGLHVILGTLLFAFAVVLLVFAVRRKATKWVVASVVGLVGIGAAWFFGSSFVQADSDPASYLMSTGFAVAFVAYGWGLWAAEKS